MVEHILFKKGLREIKENLKQYITVILIAILAVALFTGIYANWQDFSYKLNDIYTKSNMCDGIVMTEKNTETLTNFLDEQGIYYEQRLYFVGKVESYNVNVVTFNDNSKLNKPSYLSLEDYDSTMLLVDTGFLTKTGLNIGDKFKLLLPDLSSYGLPLSDISLEFRVAGTMTHPEALDNSEFSANFIYLGEEALTTSINDYLSSLGLDEIISLDVVKQIVSSLKNQYLLQGSNTLEVLEAVKGNFNVLYALDRANLPTNLTIEADVLQAKQLLYIFPIIFYLVALLIILTSISELIDKEKKNIGLLKALGYTNSEIVIHYTNIFVILCIIGGILGIIIGPLIIPSVMEQKYNILYQLPSISTPIFRPFYLVSVIILVMIVYLTAIFALAGILKKVPASSIRGDNSYQMKETLFDKLPLAKEKYLAIKMAFRNMKRKISRTFMVIFGVMGCSALLLCGFGIEDTLDNSINKEAKLIPFNVELFYETEKSYLDELEKIEGVYAVDEYSKKDISIIKDKMISSYIYILPEESHIFVPRYDDNSCLISTKVAKEINARAGDKVTFIYSGKTYEVTISEVIDLSFSQGIFIAKSSNILDISPTGAWLKTKSDTYNEQVLSEALNISGIYDGLTMSNLRAQAEDKLASVRIMTNTIKIFAILLAVVVLYNLALLNFKERIKDIATLKVLGFELKEIAASFLLEILFLTLFASGVGLLLGYPLMYAVLTINENPLLSYLYHINVDSYLYTLLITAGFSLIINLIMSSFVRKVKMVESLKAVD